MSAWLSSFILRLTSARDTRTLRSNLFIPSTRYSPFLSSTTRACVNPNGPSGPNVIRCCLAREAPPLLASRANSSIDRESTPFCSKLSLVTSPVVPTPLNPFTRKNSSFTLSPTVAASLPFLRKTSLTNSRSFLNASTNSLRASKERKELSGVLLGKLNIVVSTSFSFALNASLAFIRSLVTLVKPVDISV